MQRGDLQKSDRQSHQNKNLLHSKRYQQSVDSATQESSPLDFSRKKSTNKQYSYQPSRYVVGKTFQKLQYSSKIVLNDLENQIVNFDNCLSQLEPAAMLQKRSTEPRTILPILQKVEQVQNFQSQPLRRLETDLMMYKEIFVNPKQKVLVDLKLKGENIQEQLKGKKKIIKSQSPIKQSIVNSNYNQSPIMDAFSLEKTNLNLSQELLKLQQSDMQASQELLKLQQTDIQASQELEKLNLDQSFKCSKTQEEEDISFFDQQIQIQPPNINNLNSMNQTQTREGKLSYPPSIPLIQSYSDYNYNTNLRDLLMKAKAGMQAGDLQKESHLTFILGMINLQNKNYLQTIKFYKKFLQCAKLLNDQIGISLGFNRLGLCYYYLKQYDISIEMHQKNLDLSDDENIFVSYYNLGICFRTIGDYLRALQYFEYAMEWAKDKDELESECLALGQIGVTNISMEDYNTALDYLLKSYQLTKKIKNHKLQLDCLLLIIKIGTKSSFSQIENIQNVLQDAYFCAKSINDRKTMSICLCNIGVLSGMNKFEAIIQGQDTQTIQIQHEI